MGIRWTYFVPLGTLQKPTQIVDIFQRFLRLCQRLKILSMEVRMTASKGIKPGPAAQKIVRMYFLLEQHIYKEPNDRCEYMMPFYLFIS